jgi:hypothetical protein
MLAVILSSLLTALFDHSEHHFDSANGSFNKLVDYGNFMLTLFFTFDAVAKIILMGLYEHKRAYLKNIFNILDIMIVFMGLVSIMFREGHGWIVLLIYCIKCLRPVKLLEFN